jgi:hypothetical protein
VREPLLQPSRVILCIFPSTLGSEVIDGQDDANNISRLVQCINSGGSVTSGLLLTSNFRIFVAYLIVAGISFRTHPFKSSSVILERSGLERSKMLHLAKSLARPPFGAFGPDRCVMKTRRNPRTEVSTTLVIRQGGVRWEFRWRRYVLYIVLFPVRGVPFEDHLIGGI